MVILSTFPTAWEICESSIVHTVGGWSSLLGTLLARLDLTDSSRALLRDGSLLAVAVFGDKLEVTEVANQLLGHDLPLQLFCQITQELRVLALIGPIR